MLRDKNKGFGDIPQQAKIDEFTRSESERICQFFRKCICTYCACSKVGIIKILFIKILFIYIKFILNFLKFIELAGEK